MNRREFMVAGAAAAISISAPVSAPAMAGTVIDRGDWEFLLLRRTIHARTWKLWRDGMAFDHAYELAMIEHNQDEPAVIDFVVRSLRSTPWDFHALRLAEDEQFAPHVRFLPHTRHSLSRMYQDDFPALLDALQTELPPTVLGRIKPRYRQTSGADHMLAAYWRIMPAPEPFKAWAMAQPVAFNTQAWWADKSVRATLGLPVRVFP